MTIRAQTALAPTSSSPTPVGRVTQEHRVHRNVAIPSTIQVKMTHAEVAEIGSFSVPASTIDRDPRRSAAWRH